MRGGWVGVWPVWGGTFGCILIKILGVGVQIGHPCIEMLLHLLPHRCSSVFVVE
jgi:hypothetical protein